MAIGLLGGQRKIPQQAISSPQLLRTRLSIFAGIISNYSTFTAKREKSP
jgi:hypothetical protein